MNNRTVLGITIAVMSVLIFSLPLMSRMAGFEEPELEHGESVVVTEPGEHPISCADSTGVIRYPTVEIDEGKEVTCHDGQLVATRIEDGT